MLDILSLVTALLNRKVWKFNVGTFQSLIEIPLKDQLMVKTITDFTFFCV